MLSPHNRVLTTYFNQTRVNEGVRTPFAHAFISETPLLPVTIEAMSVNDIRPDLSMDNNGKTSRASRYNRISTKEELGITSNLRTMGYINLEVNLIINLK
jgi:hypothetical protein